MTSTTHITTGAALGLAMGAMVHEPSIAIPAAFIVGAVSHHLLDKIPHTDLGSWRDPDDNTVVAKGEMPFALADNLVGTFIVLGIFFTKEPSWAMLFGAAGANFPDIYHHVPWWGDKTRSSWRSYFDFHEFHHWTARGRLIPFGIVTNAFFICLSIYYLLTT